MEKHVYVRPQRFGNQRLKFRPRPSRLCDALCGVGIWGFGATMSGIQVALQDVASENTILREVQRVVAEPISQLSSTTLASGIIVSAAGYTTTCMSLYSKYPTVVAGTIALSLMAVMVETLWNALRVTAGERIAVVLPTAINIGLTWVLLGCSLQSDYWSHAQMRTSVASV